jgi:hypothetical protein
MLNRELCGNVRLKIVRDRAVGHITVAKLEVSHSDVASRPIMDHF